MVKTDYKKERELSKKYQELVSNQPMTFTEFKQALGIKRGRPKKTKKK